MHDLIDAIVQPSRADLISIRDVRVNPNRLPDDGGIYGCFTDDDLIANFNGLMSGDMTLFYVGIGKGKSGQTVRARWRSNHINGRARNSTLRFSLGILLADRLNLTLSRKAGTSDQIWFGADGERRLTEWLCQHVCISVQQTGDPESLERRVIAQVGQSLPLNIQGNPLNTFGATLSAMRARAKKRALAG